MIPDVRTLIETIVVIAPGCMMAIWTASLCFRVTQLGPRSLSQQLRTSGNIAALGTFIGLPYWGLSIVPESVLAFPPTFPRAAFILAAIFAAYIPFFIFTYTWLMRKMV